MTQPMADEAMVGASRVMLVEAIVAEHESALLRYAARLVNSQTLAQDVVQNVFLKLFRGWDGASRPTAQLKGWLFRVTHNEAVDAIRREARMRVLHEDHARHLEDCPGDDPDAEAHLAERRAAVLDQLQRLHPRERQVVLLRLEHGLAYHEIAEITGRGVGNVGNILHHAIRKLSARLQRKEGRS